MKPKKFNDINVDKSKYEAELSYTQVDSWLETLSHKKLGDVSGCRYCTEDEEIFVFRFLSPIIKEDQVMTVKELKKMLDGIDENLKIQFLINSLIEDVDIQFGYEKNKDGKVLNISFDYDTAHLNY